VCLSGLYKIENRVVSISPLPLSLCASVSSSFSGCSFRPLSLRGASCGATEGLLSLFFCCLGVYLRWNRRWWWCLWWWWCFITPALADRARRDGCVWVWVERGHRCEGGWGVEGRTTGGKGDGVGGLPLEWRREPSHAPLAPLELPPQSPPLVRVHAKKKARRRMRSWREGAGLDVCACRRWPCGGEKGGRGSRGGGGRCVLTTAAPLSSLRGGRRTGVTRGARAAWGRPRGFRSVTARAGPWAVAAT
jgi:hypothetical protein